MTQYFTCIYDIMMYIDVTVLLTISQTAVSKLKPCYLNYYFSRLLDLIRFAGLV